MKPGEFDITSVRTKILTDAFGEKNVEEACIFIAKACTPGGLRVSIRPTYVMIRACLEAGHGRPEPGEVFITEGKDGIVRVREGKP